LENDFELALTKLGGAVDRRPLIVTAVDFGDGLVVGCPWCARKSPLDDDWRGAEIECPSCSGPLKVNQFVARSKA